MPPPATTLTGHYCTLRSVFAANSVAYFTRCNGGSKCFASSEIPDIPRPKAAHVADDTDDPNGSIWADAFVELPGGTTFEVARAQDDDPVHPLHRVVATNPTLTTLSIATNPTLTTLPTH